MLPSRHRLSASRVPAALPGLNHSSRHPFHLELRQFKILGDGRFSSLRRNGFYINIRDMISLWDLPPLSFGCAFGAYIFKATFFWIAFESCFHTARCDSHYYCQLARTWRIHVCIAASRFLNWRRQSVFLFSFVKHFQKPLVQSDTFLSCRAHFLPVCNLDD